jgi:hypothetical protein
VVRSRLSTRCAQALLRTPAHFGARLRGQSLHPATLA